MKTAAAYLTALFAVVVSAPIRRMGAAMLLLALLLPLLLPTAASAARYEDLSVTKLTLDGVVVTNTPARLNAATPAGTAASFPSVTAGSATIQTNATVGGTLDVTGIPTFAATQVVFSAAAATTPTNMISGAGVGINVRINGTNYLLRATPN